MKIFVFVVALLSLGMLAHAECFIPDGVTMYTDRARFLAWIEVCNKSPQRCVFVFTKDLQDNITVEVPDGTKLDEVNRIDAFGSEVRIGKVLLYVENSAIKCR